MCFQCVLQVSRAFRFKQQCQRSDATLRLRLARKLNAGSCDETKKHCLRNLAQTANDLNLQLSESDCNQSIETVSIKSFVKPLNSGCAFDLLNDHNIDTEFAMKEETLPNQILEECLGGRITGLSELNENNFLLQSKPKTSTSHAATLNIQKFLPNNWRNLPQR